MAMMVAMMQGRAAMMMGYAEIKLGIISLHYETEVYTYALPLCQTHNLAGSGQFECDWHRLSISSMLDSFLLISAVISNDKSNDEIA
ncbi:MAG: hypothetical protein ACR2G4_11605 [Pyrinomonadaceae bacterium]